MKFMVYRQSDNDNVCDDRITRNIELRRKLLQFQLFHGIIDFIMISKIDT